MQNVLSVCFESFLNIVLEVLQSSLIPARIIVTNLFNVILFYSDYFTFFSLVPFISAIVSDWSRESKMLNVNVKDSSNCFIPNHKISQFICCYRYDNDSVYQISVIVLWTIV